MSATAFVLVLGSALLHAAWNALLRSGADRLASLYVMSVSCAAIAAPFAVLLPLPDRASWPYLALTAVLQSAYGLALVFAYREGRLTAVYPISRGAAPLLVAALAVPAAGELPGGWSLAGVLLISTGILGLALGRSRPPLPSVVAALGTGVFVAGYTVADGMGVRLAGQVGGYLAWMTVLQAAPLTLAYLAMRRSLRPPPWPDTLKGVTGGLLSTIAYAIAIWAMTGAPIAQVAALREASILFALAIGALWLREPIGPKQAAAGAAIAAGVACLAAGG
jgi:drug/metabolite transporter (DMT)-like permease